MDIALANYGFIIDNRRCIGCHACTVACKSEHDVPVGVNRTWVKYIEKGLFPNSTRLFSVMRCNHCDNAPCVEICPVTALYRRPDGIVDFDNRRCIGCRACMQACPYDALYIDPQTRTAAKCNYCAHRVDRGLEPACVNVCPTQAIISGDLDDPDSEISKLRSRQQVSVRKPEKGTAPALFYIDGDVASLDPAESDSANEGMWSDQSRGVGHYARFVDQKIQQNSARVDGDESLENPNAGHGIVDSLEKFLSLGERQNGVLALDSTPSGQSAGKRVVAELKRRVYDAPKKGTLWGWQVAAYMWTKAISAGCVLLPFAALTFGLADPSAGILIAGILLGLFFLGATGALLAGDLDQPTRFIYVLLRPQWRSWLVRGAYIISAYGGLMVVWLVLTMLSNPLAHWLNLPLILAAAATALYTALLFAQAKGRDFWQSPLLGTHMVIHAVIAGGATFLLAAPWYSDPRWSSYLRLAVAVALLAKLAIDWLELNTTHSTADAARTAKDITSGDYARLYWLAVVLGGTVIPLGLVLWTLWLAPIAALLILAGLYVSEHIWVRAPQRLPLA